VTDCNNPITANADVDAARRLARAVVNRASFDQDIERIGAQWCLWRTDAWRDECGRDDQCGR
jgi:hypothetical protein